MQKIKLNKNNNDNKSNLVSVQKILRDLFWKFYLLIMIYPT